MELVKKRVVDLYARCSYPVRTDARVRGGMAASDTCQASATSAVEGKSGIFWYRCHQHEGLLANGERGPVHESINVMGMRA